MTRPLILRSRMPRPTSSRPSNCSTSTHRRTRRRGWSCSSVGPRRSSVWTRRRASTRRCEPSRRHARTGQPEQFGRAVAVFAQPVSAVMSYPDQVATLLDEAQRVLGDDHRALRARLMALEAFKYSAYQLQGRDGRALADRAVRLARDAGDGQTLTAALFARAVSLESTAQMTERRALGEELVAFGRAAGGSAAMATTHGLRILARVHLELGDAESLSATIDELARTGEELRWLPALVFEAQWRATQALLEGRFDDVHAAWHDMRRHARAYRAVAGIRGSQAYYLAREQGDLAGLVGPLEQIADGEHGEPLCACDARRRTGRLGRRGGGAAHPRSAHPRRHSSEPNGERMGGGACLADGGRRRRIVELTCGAALRAPRAVRGSVARHRHRAGMPRGSRPLPGHVEHDARNDGTPPRPTSSERWTWSSASGDAPSYPERGTGRPGSCRPGAVPATTARREPSSAASCNDTRELGMRRLSEQAEERLAR